jgi:hypothetical protein
MTLKDVKLFLFFNLNLSKFHISKQKHQKLNQEPFFPTVTVFYIEGTYFE